MAAHHLMWWCWLLLACTLGVQATPATLVSLGKAHPYTIACAGLVSAGANAHLTGDCLSSGAFTLGANKFIFELIAALLI
jgi:hypothetical protein